MSDELDFSTGSLFTDEELHREKPSGYIQVSTSLIRGASKQKKKKIMRAGKAVYINEITTNDKRIEDTCIELFQGKQIKTKINYKELQEKALVDLEPKFEEYGLITSEENSNLKNQEILNMRLVAIDNHIKNSISESIPKTITFPIKDFIKRTGIQRIQNRFNEALKVIYEASNKSGRSWMSQTVVFGERKGFKVAEIKNDLTQGSIVPKFRLRFNDKIKNYLTEQQIRSLSLDKFIELELPNKGSLVDDLIMESDPEALIEVIGVGLFNSYFGKGFAKSERKNRNLFRKSYLFDFDLLIRSIINLSPNTSWTEFEFDELKDIIGANTNISWEQFKKNIFKDLLKELEDKTELKCKYKLVPNQKNWTHIKLIPSYKTDSLGFEASKYGFDYMAHFIAVQHKFFQPNNLNNSLENFIPHVQSAIYSTKDDEEIWGKTLLEWREYTQKVFKVESELIEFINLNEDLLIDNGLFYDEKLMVIMKKNYKLANIDELDIDEDDNVIELPTNTKKKNSKNSFIQTSAYKVIDPITSLRYLNELLIKGKEDSSAHIFEFIPFSFATLDENWVYIESIEDYPKYKDLIKVAVYKKKYSFFRFDDSKKKEKFMIHVEKGSFKEIDDKFKELMLSLT